MNRLIALRSCILAAIAAMALFALSDRLWAEGLQQGANAGYKSMLETTDQIVVIYRPSAEMTAAMAASPGHVETLSRVAGVPITYFREMSGNGHVFRLPRPMPNKEVETISRRIAELDQVAYAAADKRGWYDDFIPNDPRYNEQWHYRAPYGIHLPPAWDITTGNSNVIVAVIDSGILLSHPDLAGRTVPGYDFLSRADQSRDNDGRDPDPSDPGDWVTAVESNTVGGPYFGCGEHNSSWHGSHVAGTIGAATNNNVGVAGVAWGSRILPVRTGGGCGHYFSDDADAIRWAAGLSVPGVPNNSNPAWVINLSLGLDCNDQPLHDAMRDARNAGTLIVISAGNENRDVFNQGNYACRDVAMLIAATSIQGNRASYSSFGSAVSVSAPGGDGLQTAEQVLSTIDAGTTSPSSSTYGWKIGTSMAAPHVSGVAALALSMRSWMTPTDTQKLLGASITPFPSGSTCNTSICGTGIINAERAVRDIYIDSGYAGAITLGLPHVPYKTVFSGHSSAWNNARLRLKAGNYPEIVTLDKPLEIVADGGVATIGQ